MKLWLNYSAKAVDRCIQTDHTIEIISVSPAYLWLPSAVWFTGVSIGTVCTGCKCKKNNSY